VHTVCTLCTRDFADVSEQRPIFEHFEQYYFWKLWNCSKRIIASTINLRKDLIEKVESETIDTPNRTDSFGIGMRNSKINMQKQNNRAACEDVANDLSCLGPLGT
jgi:hypothetical protein